MKGIVKFLKEHRKALIGITAMVGVPLAAYAAVAPSSIRHVDTPADEECLTFESSQNAFEWQSCMVATLAGDLTLQNSEFIDNGTNGTINLGRNDSGTVTLGSLDDDATAALTINPGGVTTLTLGGSTDTVVSGADSGYTLANSESVDSDADGTITLGRDDAGTVSVTAKDNDATAALTVLPGGAAALALGGSSTTSTTLLGDDTGDAELVTVVNSVGPADWSVHTENLIFCGQNDENGTIYFAPATAEFGHDGSEAAIAGTVCDASDNATESTADAAISTLAVKVHGMRCRLNGTLGASETLTMTLRTAEGNVLSTDGAATAVTCAMAAGETECRTNAGSTTNVAAGATMALQAVEVSNNADDDGWCIVTVSFP